MFLQQSHIVEQEVPAHADTAAKPLEEVKISTALPIACSRFSLSFYIRFKCSHHDHAFEVMFCFRLTVDFHNLIICSVHWLPGTRWPSSGTKEMCSSASGPLVILMTTKSFVLKCVCVCVCVCVHLCEGSLHVRHLTQFIERVFHNYNTCKCKIKYIIILGVLCNYRRSHGSSENGPGAAAAHP